MTSVWCGSALHFHCWHRWQHWNLCLAVGCLSRSAKGSRLASCPSKCGDAPLHSNFGAETTLPLQRSASKSCAKAAALAHLCHSHPHHRQPLSPATHQEDLAPRPPSSPGNFPDFWACSGRPKFAASLSSASGALLLSGIISCHVAAPTRHCDLTTVAKRAKENLHSADSACSVFRQAA